MKPPSYRSAIHVTDADGTRPVGTSIEVADGFVRILNRRSFHRKADVFAEIPFADIANVRAEKARVLFDQLRDGLVLRTFAMPLGRKRREALLAALPASDTVEAFVPEFAAAKRQVADYHAALERNVGSTWVTYLVIAACIGVYVWMLVAGVDPLDLEAGDLLFAGGNLAPATLSGEWWRLLSSGFVHGGLVHLALNMYFLFSVGRQAERLFGHLLYSMVYLGALLGGSLLSIAVHDNVVSVGASGALFGIFGGIFAYMMRNRGAVPDSVRKETMKGIAACVAYNLLYGMKEGIDNWCHVGGLAAGFACGLVAAFPPRVTDRDSAILSRFLLLAALIPALSFPIYRELQRTMNPLVSAFHQCDVIAARFMEGSGEVIEPRDNGDPKTFQTALEIQIAEFFAPQIAILEAVPRDKLSPEQLALLDKRLLFTRTFLEAMTLQTEAYQRGDESLDPEVKALFEKVDKLGEELQNAL